MWGIEKTKASLQHMFAHVTVEARELKTPLGERFRRTHGVLEIVRKNIAGLMRQFASGLPSVRAHELILHKKSDYIKRVRETEWEPARKKKEKAKK